MKRITFKKLSHFYDETNKTTEVIYEYKGDETDFHFHNNTLYSLLYEYYKYNKPTVKILGTNIYSILFDGWFQNGNFTIYHNFDINK